MSIRYIFLIGFVVFVLSFNNVLNSVILDDSGKQKEQHPKYAVGKVLVKFKERVEPESVTTRG